MIHLDTHATLWLYTNELEKFPKKLLKLMEASELYISHPIRLELNFLFEVGKINVTEDKIISSLKKEIDLKISDTDIKKLFNEACHLTWTRDPFDRLIVAASLAEKATLITRDRTILQNYKMALWD